MEDRLFVFLLIITTSVLYFYACFCGFVFDDLSAVVNNKDVLGESPLKDLIFNDFWGTPMTKESSHKSYRPFTVLTFRINFALFGGSPCSYHVTNVLLHFAVCCLVFQLNKLFVATAFLCKTHVPTKTPPGGEKVHKKSTSLRKTHHMQGIVESDQSFIVQVATVLFVVHPIHTEAVTGVVGRAELLSAIFMILAILFYANFTVKSLVASFLFCALAMASKEQGITVLAVLLVFDIMVVHKLSVDDFCLLLVTSVSSPKKVRYKSLLLRVFLIVLFGFFLLYLRFLIMGNTLPHFDVFDNPASAASFPSRQLTLNYLLPVNSWLLLNPSNLLCDWTMGTIPLITSIFDWRNLATVLFWIVFVCIGMYSYFGDSPFCKLTAVGVAMTTFPFLPASNLLFTVGFVVAERILYAPSIGFTLLVAVGFHKLHKKLGWDRLVSAALAIIIAAHALKTVDRNYAWKDERTLFQSGLRVTKNNAKVWNNIGHTYEGEKNWTEALKYFSQAVEVQADDLGAHMNVGRMLEALDKFEEAEATYWKAKDLLPKVVPGKSYTTRIAQNHLKLFTRLGNVIKTNASRLAEADQLYKEAISMKSTFIEAYMNRGDILVQMKREREAIAVFQSALQHTDNKSDIFFNIGVVYGNLGNRSGAIEGYTFAIFHNPNHVKALYNSAVIFQETRDKELLGRAKIRIEHVLKLEPHNLLARTLLGSIHMDLNQNKEAIECWDQVLKVEPSQRISLFNKALLLSRTDRKSPAAITATEELLKHHPEHTKGLLLYGDLLLNVVKDIQKALSVYRRIVELEPGNTQARHNYCVALVEDGRLEEAESCLAEVAEISPHETHIKENLAIVRHRLSLKKPHNQQAVEEGVFAKQEPVKRTAPEIKEPTEEQRKEPAKEEEIYVAKPVKRDDESLTEQAGKVVKNLRAMSADQQLDLKLARAKRAVEKLKQIKSKADDAAKAKCKAGEEAQKEDGDSELRKRALKALEDMEAQL